MKMVKKSLCVLFAGSMLATSTGFAEVSQNGTQQVKGPNQLINEGRALLWAKAYRIDKELISKTDTHRSSSVSTSGSREDSTDSGGTSPMKILASSVLGGLIGGYAGPVLGIGTLGGTLSGNLIGAGLTAESSSSSKSSDSSGSTMTVNEDSHSETYQIHKKADTWVLLVVDKEGYKKARAAISQSELLKNSSCVKQSQQFLDTLLSDYRSFSDEEFQAFGNVIKGLETQREIEAIKADQLGKVSAINDKIDEFVDQRISVIKINYQDILARKGECNEDLGQNMEAAAGKLFTDLKRSSVFFDGTSVARVPFANLQTMTVAGKTESSLKIASSQARMMVLQAQTLKKMQDLGFVEFEKNLTANRKTSDTYLRIKNSHLVQYQQNQTKIEKGPNGYVASAIAGTGVSGVYLLVGGLAESFFSDVGATNLAERLMSVGSVSLAAGLGGMLAYENYRGNLVKENPVLWASMVKEIQADKELNDALNTQVTITEALFNLGSSAPYTAKRNALISNFKSNAADSILRGIANGKAPAQKYSYSDYLLGDKIISSTEYDEMVTIMDFMAQNRMSGKYIDYVQVSADQAQTLLTTVQSMKSAASESQDIADLNKLESRLSKEIEVINLLK